MEPAVSCLSVIHSVHQTLGQLEVILCILALLIYKASRYLSDRRRNPSRLPPPPGPKGYPLIGNIFDMPTSQQWRTYADWAKVYGDVFSFKVLGQRIIVLNSLEAAQELFEKRSSNYSDRPRMPMMLELMDFGYIFSLIPYGQWWRRHRRSFKEHFHANAVWKYQHVQARETRAFLNKLLQSPERFILHIRETLASSIMSIAYGVKIKGSDDPYIVNAEESIKGMAIAGVPGSFLVDLIPALKHVPGWLPGAGFKEKAAYWAQVNHNVVDLPFNRVVQEMKEGVASPSLAATLIAALPEVDEKLLIEETKLAKNVAAVAYLAGADTTLSSLQTFFLAMAMYPKVQGKAQAELDAVIGSQRLPEFSDRPSLPYVNALVKETMRWQLVGPLAIAHMATDDDVYEGYFIPKGTIIIGNAWAILHDERVFKDPEEYRPERYLKDGQLNPSVRQPEASAFGFGRRICPGRFYSDNTLFSMVSSILHAFNITPGLDEKGEPAQLSNKMTSGLLSYPEPFMVNIKPRSDSAESLIRDGILGDT
ncbi:hypothetical protein D9619_013035 [Psilocybe cf. subviscida]|uniref:Cytochrome P450 n=1 Tax=Psilocybe cf. subviscida TaxID=2480587 RepID=A0A8H5B140_9AGAR|nr:hypothetical protein D9619_013035 [Psilocybe cf. subviscida]